MPKANGKKSGTDRRYMRCAGTQDRIRRTRCRVLTYLRNVPVGDLYVDREYSPAGMDRKIRVDRLEINEFPSMIGHAFTSTKSVTEVARLACDAEDHSAG